MADIETAAEAYGIAREWLEANPDKIDAVEAWVKENQAQAREAPNPWHWLKEHAGSKRLGDEAERLFGGPRSLLTFIEDDFFGQAPGSCNTIDWVRGCIAARQQTERIGAGPSAFDHTTEEK